MHSIIRTIMLIAVSVAMLTPSARGQASADAEFDASFVRLCDLACERINNPERQTPKPVPFYIDSYAVRALCVAYDMTQTERYLATCKQWADRMIEYQEQMTPKGGYYMNYGRKPGEKEGNWYVADNSSIAMGILATAIRCDRADRAKYLASVQLFADLVAKHYIGEARGVMNAFWYKYPGEWWCSSGLFGSLAFLLAAETKNAAFEDIGEGAVGWLNHLDLPRTKFEYWKDGAPTVVMYVLEAYSAGMAHIDEGMELHEDAVKKIRWTLDWMPKNQASRAGAGVWDYSTQWGSKLGGLPFHMYVLSHHVPDGRALREAADEELRHIGRLLAKDDSGRLSQLAAFAMMSYAERLRPGAMYRTSRQPSTPIPR